ncbi:MAG: helix-turn-helix domain-containing protein [Gemmatimonadetes bacterium]|nr:helix-turn-helix domain-containing protein [Gemmatimonadota bacterium]
MAMMTKTTTRLTAAVETYLADLQRVRASGGATGERSSYGPLTNLLNAISATLKPKVFCVGELADQGAGHPDFGLYAAKQVQKGQPKQGQVPEGGVVEVKAADDDAWLTAASDQVSRYWDRYRLVLVTNTRDFVLVGEDAAGRPAKLETFRLAASAAEFAQRLENPRAFASETGAGLGEYLCRALAHRARLAEPRDLAWLLASHARDALARVEAAGDAPSLEAVRTALEEALGVRFEGERGARFFRSTLVQTLFYGVFSAWVLWARQAPRSDRFDWSKAVWHLRAPVMQALFQQLSQPGRLQPLGLVEVLDWTSAALDRVDCDAFFARFNEGEAVTYFYEPFLEAFDPELRKQLGVWYTPAEVVRYMVARVDKALRDDLGIADGLAAENVYVLDPCCGTGAYLAEVLRRIAVNLENQGLGAMTGARVKQAATERVFGFEIMPAPFVVAHLQVGLTMQALDAALADDGQERAQVFLTNALTGWEPRPTKPLPFPELEEERDRAERVKQETPILVILGNPPYNGFAGMAVDEERELSEAYRMTKRVRRPEGQGLNDLYVRFFRMAERRIAKTGQGVVCFISNYSWLDGLSFTGMREHYLEEFDAIRIDCLNGDKYKTGKVAPDGSPDPSIFSTKGDPVGIQVGTAIATLIRKADHAPAEKIGFRHLWGPTKREEYRRMVAALEDAADSAAIERAWAEDAAGETILGEVVKAILAGESPLRVWRKHRKFTLDTLAERVGVSKGYLSQIENGQKPGTLGLFRRLAGVLDVAMDALVGPSFSPGPNP